LHNRPQRILLIAKRDYLATIRTKAFIIGLVVAPILFGGGFLGVVLMQSKPDIKERSIAIVDATGIVAPAVIQAAQERNTKELFDKTTHRQVQPRYVFEILPPAANPKLQRLELSDRVRHERLYAFVEIGPSVLDAAPSALPAANEKDSPPGPVATYINRTPSTRAFGACAWRGWAWTRAVSPACLRPSRSTASVWSRAIRKPAKFAKPARKTKARNSVSPSASCSCWA
jgi:hypothetical protein